MYCSSCGSAITQNLIYCNRCGANLGGNRKDDANKASEVSPNMLAAAMVATFVFGMATTAALLRLATREPIALVVLALSFLLMVAMEIVFTALLLRRRKAGKTIIAAAAQPSEPARKELYSVPAGILAEPIPSVTEQTTGLLEPVYRERKSTKEL